jgi:YfiH family protein
VFDSRIRAGVELLTCRALDEHGVAHGFTSRRNGFGDRANGAGDHVALARALGLEATAAMKQVHGCHVRTLADAGRTPECDAVVTRRHGLGLIVHAADCVPVLMWAESTNAVSAVHAGWRGTLQNVTAAAVDTLVTDSGASADELHVVFGPAIRACCFEVGDEVVDAFVDAGRDRGAISRPGPRERRHVDLVEDNRRQLVEAGVRPEKIYDSGRCTACENERFYSYRKEGKGVGRLMGVIAVKS